MIERVLAGVLAALLLFVAGAFLLPREVHVERSIEIERPVNTVYVLLNRLETFPAWSPWIEHDPDNHYGFDGPVSGAGSRLSWRGDPRRVGTGTIEITETRPRNLVKLRIELERQGRANSEFRVQRIAGGSRVTWSVDSDLVEGRGFFGGLVTRYFGLLFDRWLGGDLERGLQRFARFAEALPGADFSGLSLEWLEVPAVDVLQVRGADNLAAAFREITTFMAANGVQRTGQPMTVTRLSESGRTRVDAAIPAEAGDEELSGRLEWGQSPAGRAVRVVHRGDYASLAAHFERLQAYLAAHGIAHANVSWEHYISDPNATPEADRITHIYILLES